MNQSTVIQSQLLVRVFDGVQRITHVINPKDHISSGGVGDVYRLVRPGKPNQCIKIYRSPRSDAKAKLLAMLQQPPKQLNTIAGGKDYVQFAWPIAMVEDTQGQCIGFVMPEVDFKATQSLQPYFVPKAARLKLSPEARSLNGRLKLARNIAALMADLHSQGHAFIDFKDQNVRIYPELCIAAFIDTDGYRIESKSGAAFPGLETTPTFNSPESAKGERKALTQNHDDFVLALVLFQVLNFGIHPFQGIPSATNNNLNFDLDNNIIHQNYPYGARKHALMLPKQESTHESWPSKTRALFEQTFLNSDPARRVRASEWARHLDELIAHEMRACEHHPKDIEHVHFKGKPCHMCKLLEEGASQSVPFATPPISGNVNHGTTPIQQPAKNSLPKSTRVVPQPAPAPSGVLPPPVKRSKLRWVLPLIAIAILAAFFSWISKGASDQTYSPPNAPAPEQAPAVKGQHATSKILTRSDYPAALKGLEDQLALFESLYRAHSDDLEALIQLARTSTSRDEFLQGSIELFTKPSDAWQLLSSKMPADAGAAYMQAAKLDTLARAEYDAVGGVTQQVLTNQALAAATLPSSTVFTTNLAHYLLAVSPKDALATSISAMSLQARTGQPMRIHTLEVMASAAMRMNSENQRAAESILMAGVWAAQDIERRCQQMSRYASLYPELQAAAGSAKELAQKILIANGQALGRCDG
jgi:serine/threonine protein kinase